MPEKQNYALFETYTRKWLHKKTGFSLNYLCRIATGLKKSEEELFRKD